MKYEVLYISDEINVSSSSDYFIKIVLREGKKRVRRDYWISNDIFMSNATNQVEWNPPQYLAREVRQRVAQLMQTGKARYFEWNRDKVKRYTDLRYHDEQLAAHYAKCLQEVS